MCTNVTSLTQKYLTAPDSSLDGAAIWYKSGFPAQLLIKILLCNLILSLLNVVDPLCVYGGKYECDGDRRLSEWAASVSATASGMMADVGVPKQVLGSL